MPVEMPVSNCQSQELNLSLNSSKVHILSSALLPLYINVLLEMYTHQVLFYNDVNNGTMAFLLDSKLLEGHSVCHSLHQQGQ